MNIKIWNNKYAIKSDTNQYKLLALKEKADGGSDDTKEEGVVVGYYSTLRSLFEDLVAVEQRTNKCTTMDGYIKHIEKINTKLAETLAEINGKISPEESFAKIVDLIESRQSKSIKELEEKLLGKTEK